MLTDIEIRKVYDTETSNLVRDFYVPVLGNSVEYKRITGYFSAGSLATAAEGIFKFIENNGVYKLIMGNQISNEDFDAIVRGVKDPSELIHLDLCQVPLFVDTDSK